ncbi:STAS domain-containing protein [Leptospira ognonensis]|uniref:STAS domain-containing protein n=1 Tax=Leptospira ognonensis TaxID=2484945 RepID=A0A4R9JWG4_9LEPT|nr:STAS domain-containing protein [Leptospira ognonensis]TGL57333.1 STAS domain-containing protein [Leptospira ognonensis]
MEPIIRQKEIPGGKLTAWEGYLTIQYVSMWRDKLIGLNLSPGSKYSIDLSRIQRIDTAGIQFLIFTKMFCDEKHIHLTILNHSIAVLKMYDVLGLVSFFGDKIKVSKEQAGEFEFAYGTRKEPNGSF